MSLGIGPIGPPLGAVPVSRERFVPSAPVTPSAAPAATDRVELSFGSPPPELHAEVDAAYQRSLDLASQNRELHFESDKKSGRIIVQVRDLDGNVIRTIPNEKALHVVSGEPL